MSIMMSNLEDKSNGTYTDLSLGRVLIDTELLSFADFLEDIIHKENDRLNSERVDFIIDSGTLSRWNLPFDNFCVTLYRGGYELENKDFTSNYMYMEHDNFRTFWLDLYYIKKDYDVDDVYRDILREINNFKNRDLKKYFKECENYA